MAPQRILVKASPGGKSVRLMFGAAPVVFTAEPLFKSIRPAPTLGAAVGEVWQILNSAT